MRENCSSPPFTTLHSLWTQTDQGWGAEGAGWRINLAVTVFMTLYGHIPYKKTLDKRKNCTRELFSVALTKISHKKTLKAALCSVNYFCQKKLANLCKSAFTFGPEGVGLGKAEEGCHVWCVTSFVLSKFLAVR